MTMHFFSPFIPVLKKIFFALCKKIFFKKKNIQKTRLPPLSTRKKKHTSYCFFFLQKKNHVKGPLRTVPHQ